MGEYVCPAPAVDRFHNGDPRRLRKLDRTRPIDASVALALAVQGAVLGEGGASVYERRPAIILSVDGEREPIVVEGEIIGWRGDNEAVMRAPSA